MTSVSSTSTLAFGHGIQRVTMAAARPTGRFNDLIRLTMLTLLPTGQRSRMLHPTKPVSPWAEDAGNPGGALSMSGLNATEAGKAYIFQYSDGAFSYGGASSVDITFEGLWRSRRCGTPHSA